MKRIVLALTLATLSAGCSYPNLSGKYYCDEFGLLNISQISGPSAVTYTIATERSDFDKSAYIFATDYTWRENADGQLVRGRFLKQKLSVEYRRNKEGQVSRADYYLDADADLRIDFDFRENGSPSATINCVKQAT